MTIGAVADIHGNFEAMAQAMERHPDVPLWICVGDLASRTGRRDTLGLSPRNMLDLTDAAKGAGRAAFQGSVAEVAADIKRVRGIGAAWMTFDLPRAGIPAMVRAMERLAGEVKSAAA